MDMNYRATATNDEANSDFELDFRVDTAKDYVNSGDRTSGIETTQCMTDTTCGNTCWGTCTIYGTGSC
jgi:hypothetical protein